MFEYTPGDRFSYSAKSVLVKFKPDGWASLTWNDSTGEVAVQSDWLDGTYRWNTKALGESKDLGHFLAHRASPDYICRKLFVNKQQELDIDGMKKSIRAMIVDGRRHYEIDREHARRMWDEVGFIFTYSATESDIYHQLIGSELEDFVNRDVESVFKYREPPIFTQMKETIVPALLEAIRVDINSAAA